MNQNYSVSSLLPKSIDSDSSRTTNPKISPVLKFFNQKNKTNTPVSKSLQCPPPPPPPPRDSTEGVINRDIDPYIFFSFHFLTGFRLH